MGMIGDILKNQLPFSDQIESHAMNIAHINRLVAKAWEKRIVEGKTDSKAEVWSNWKKFVQAAENTSMAAEKLAMAAKSGDMKKTMMAVQAVGKTCGECHEPYRKPKGQRFKR